MTHSVSTHDRPHISLQVVTGGHPFEPEPFFAIFNDLCDSVSGLSWTSTHAPSIGHDVVVFYDMPGLRFTRSNPPVELLAPSPEQKLVFDQFADAGTGLVFMHHAVASWPAWPEFADMIGARFHYEPQSLRGVDYPDSGYVFDVEHTVSIVEPRHPVCEGLDETFVVTDELYCFPVFEDDVVPLMRTTFPTHDSSNFYSADLAIRGRMNERKGWSHPPGSNLVAWATSYRNAPIVYLQFGDGPATYANPHFRRALSNSISWVASTPAKEWARQR